MFYAILKAVGSCCVFIALAHVINPTVPSWAVVLGCVGIGVFIGASYDEKKDGGGL